MSAVLQCLASTQRETQAPADPTNYGPRLTRDWRGLPVPHAPSIIVLHETVVDETTALNLFRRRHDSDAHQASYHVLIARDGRRIRVVPDAMRAFGAGDSALNGFAVQLKQGVKPSINNVALHVSLVSPADGVDGERSAHSGYTAEQYRSLADLLAYWQVSYAISPTSVVTHQEVDRSGSRKDPRSFEWGRLRKDLQVRSLACGATPLLADLRRPSPEATVR
ncbi:MAG: peptidoglycan recognition family protein [Synechococcaceae cyanobacterium]|nr:peptidoglycan recognition family protein [Synechococcaceae cyanobacterium]